MSEKETMQKLYEEMAIYGRGEMRCILESEWQSLQSEIEKLKAERDIAVEALEFYADKFNWRTNSGKIGITPLTNGQDAETIDGHWTCGKLARQTLERVKGKVEWN